MTPEQFENSIQLRLQALRDNRPREVFIIAQELKTAIQLRIQTTGTNAEGAAFVGYSPGWSNNRQRRGRQTAFVDFTDTGRLWNNIQPEIIENTADKTVVEIGARSRDNELKLIGALRRPKRQPRGSIIRPSADEIALAAEANRRRIQKYIRP